MDVLPEIQNLIFKQIDRQTELILRQVCKSYYIRFKYPLLFKAQFVKRNISNPPREISGIKIYFRNAHFEVVGSFRKDHYNLIKNAKNSLLRCFDEDGPLFWSDVMWFDSLGPTLPYDVVFLTNYLTWLQTCPIDNLALPIPPNFYHNFCGQN